MSEVRLLIVDSDITVQQGLKEYFTSAGYQCDICRDGITALKMFRRRDFGAIVLDIELPELDGVNVCRQIRRVSDIPIIITTARQGEKDRLAGFDAGADDYVTKPFSRAVLLARLRVLLRRSGMYNDAPLQKLCFSGLYIDNVSRIVSVDECPVMLSPKEYDLLFFLAQNPNMAFSRNDLLNEVWGYDFFGSDRTVDTHIKMLRDSIRPYQNFIVTVWGFGYRFEWNE